ncbi:hypothetical protein LCGC14_2894860, partial [marine sediment metagenome]
MTSQIPTNRLKAAVVEGYGSWQTAEIIDVHPDGTITMPNLNPYILSALPEKLKKESLEEIRHLLIKMTKIYDDRAEFAARLLELEPWAEKAREALRK